MPYAVTHMLIPMILLDVFRDNILKIERSKLPNKYILIAGLAGLLPDTDIILSFFFGSFFTHRAITHVILVPFTFLFLSSIFYLIKKYNWSKIFLMIFIGTGIHIILDFITAGSIALFYPLSETLFSINLIPIGKAPFVYAASDAILLWLWFVRIIFRERIQDIV